MPKEVKPKRRRRSLRSRVDSIMYDAEQWCAVDADPYSKPYECAQAKAEVRRAIRGEILETEREYAEIIRALKAAADELIFVLEGKGRGLGTLQAKRAWNKARANADALLPDHLKPPKKSPLLRHIFAE